MVTVKVIVIVRTTSGGLRHPPYSLLFTATSLDRSRFQCGRVDPSSMNVQMILPPNRSELYFHPKAQKRSQGMPPIPRFQNGGALLDNPRPSTHITALCIQALHPRSASPPPRIPTRLLRIRHPQRCLALQSSTKTWRSQPQPLIPLFLVSVHSSCIPPKRNILLPPQLSKGISH